MKGESDDLTSLSIAASYAHTSRQAIYLAIRKGKLKAQKRYVMNEKGFEMEQWVVKKSDLDDYRRSKYNTEKRVVNGQKLFDLDADRFSVLHASKILSQMLGIYYPAHKLYYLLRTGQARGYKMGGAWIIKKDEMLRIGGILAQSNQKIIETA